MFISYTIYIVFFPQISGDFSSVQDALYNATGRLRDNLFASTENSAGTRSLSSLRVDNSPYGRLHDVVPLGSQLPAVTSHSLNRHTFSRDIDHLAHSRSLDRPSSPGLWTRNLDRPPSPGLWARNLDRPFSPGLWTRNLDRPSSPGLWTPPVHLSLSLCYQFYPKKLLFLLTISYLNLMQTMAGINSRGVNDFNWGLTSRRGGLELVRLLIY